MAHHKRGKRKSARAGCLMCKPWKGNGTKGSANGRTVKERRMRERERDQHAELLSSREQLGA